MTEESNNAGPDYRLDPESNWGKAYRTTAILAVVGTLMTVAGAFTDMHRFAFSYLFAFMSFLAIALGAVFFCLIQWLTSSGWSVTVRRITEFLLWPMALFAVLFVPIYLNVDQLYPWTSLDHHDEAAEHAEEGAEGDHGAGDHGEAHGGEHSGGEDGVDHTQGRYDPATHWASVDEHAVHAAHESLLLKKVPYLNMGFFSIRMVLYFLIWIFVARKLWTYSTTQDEDGDPEWTNKMRRLAPWTMILIAFSSTFAAFDWMMSLEPSWFSTIYGVNFFADCIVSMFATTILISMSLRDGGHFGNAVNKEHFHDLGKLLFGFLVFHAYVNFSQYMLIWYASIPEEVTYYHLRWVGGWKAVSLALIFGHFLVPFFMIVSRNSKRGNSAVLRVGAAMILVFHFIMVYWLVLPYHTPGELNVHWMDFACLLAVGGSYFTLVFYRMTKTPLVALKDPRLSRALNFINA